ncbi:protein FAM228A [Amphiprion ocellaris]|uniref:protein FAM228A n=1 Tax=Amphiprion ocellaris TaxID=80972 RepID=UPI000C2FF935|nr:protein FAM228A [Amphiprion ocellaris]
MMDMKKNSSRGVIMVHTPLPVSLLRSQFQDVTVASDCRKILSQMTRNIRNMRSASSRQEQLSSASLRRLQVKIESENQQMTEIIQPLVDTENTLIKELQSFLELRDVTELRRKELLHKSWTERVWFPLQRKVEQHLSSCGPTEVIQELPAALQRQGFCVSGNLRSEGVRPISSQHHKTKLLQVIFSAAENSRFKGSVSPMFT